MLFNSRRETASAPEAADLPKRIILVCNPKGGVGKTALCANLSLSISRLPGMKGKRIGLVDFDLSGANLSTVFFRLPLEEVRHRNVTRWPQLELEKLGAAELDPYLFSGPGGLTIAAAPCNLTDGHVMTHQEADRVLRALVRSHDCLIIDGGPGITDAVDMAMHHATDILAVTNREGQSLAQLSKLVSALCCPEGFTLDVQEPGHETPLREAMQERLGKLRVVMNDTMASGKYRLDRDEIERVLNQPVYAEIPYCEGILAALHGKGDQQALDLDRRGSFARAVTRLAEQLWSEGTPGVLKHPAGRGLFRRRQYE